MLVAAIILSIITLLLTLLLIAAVGSINRLRGPDYAGAAIQLLFIALPRWLCLAFALGCLLSLGAFSWLSVPPGAQIFLVLTTHLILGVCSLVNMFAAVERGRIASWLHLALIPPIALPILVITIAFLGLAEPPSRLLISILLLLTALLAFPGPIVLLFASMARSAANAKLAEKADTEQREKNYQDRLAQLNALPPDAHLHQWIQFTYANEPGDVCQRARDAILARPNLSRELAESLRNQASFEAVWFISQHMQSIPPEVAPALADGILAMAEHMRKYSLTAEEPFLNQFNGECERILEAIGKCPNSSTDFTPSIQAVHDALGSGKHPNSQEGRDLLLSWLRTHSTKASA